MTLYRLYIQNGNRAGFWVQHRTWGNICAHVQSIAGHADGALPDNARVADTILMRVFDIRSGRPIDGQPVLSYHDDRNYTRIAEPYWCHGLEKERSQTTARS